MNIRSILTLSAWFIMMMAMSAGFAFAEERATLDIGPDQTWSFAKEKNLTLKGDVGADGLSLQFEAGSEPNNNFCAASTDWRWMVPTRGRITAEVRAELRHGHYFAIRLYTAKGKSFGATFGTPDKGFIFTPENKTAEVAIDAFRGKDGEKLASGTEIVRVGLEFAIEPGVTNTVYVNKLTVEPDAAQ